MKKLLLLFSLFICSALQAQITFQKTFGGSGDNSTSTIKQTNDSGLVILGNTSGFNAGYYDMMLIKLDKNYNLQWSRIFGDGPSTGLNWGYDVVQTTDTGYAIAAYQNRSSGYGYILKLDKLGNIQWTKIFRDSSTSNYALRSIMQTQDGNIVAFGDGIGNDFLLIKMDINGSLIWAKTYGGTNDEYGYRVIELSNGDLDMVGSTYSFGAGQLDVYLVKTDNTGNFLWGKTYGGTGQEEAYDIKNTSDNGFIMTGTTTSWGINEGIYLIKTDSTGALQWSKTYGGTIEDYGLEVLECSHGAGFAVACSTYTYKYAMIIRTDILGNLLWAKGYGDSTNQNDFYSIRQTSDNGFILSGSITSSINADIFLVKTDSNGTSGCNEQTLFPNVTTPSTITGSGGNSSTYGFLDTCTTITVYPSLTIQTLCSSASINDFSRITNLEIYPNPATDNLTIESTQQATIEITNIQGQLIETLATTGNKTTIDISTLAKGMYFIKVNTEKGVAVKKFIKE